MWQTGAGVYEKMGEALTRADVSPVYRLPVLQTQTGVGTGTRSQSLSSCHGSLTFSQLSTNRRPKWGKGLLEPALALRTGSSYTAFETEV